MESYNFYTAWICILCGFVAGAIQGSFFHNRDWMGGYTSWKRRMTRLGHISFFGLAIINLMYVFSLDHLNITNSNNLISTLLIIGAITMPVVCYSSAFIKKLRHLFFIPVLSLVAGVTLFLIELG